MIFDLDLTPQLNALPRHPQAFTIPPRTTAERWATLHYSGVPGERYANRERSVELARIVAECKWQLFQNYGTKAKPAYPDGYLYDVVVLSDGTIVRTRASRVQLWHCGNATGNAQSWSIHVALGVGQDLTEAQRAGLWRLLDSLNVPLVGHSEWPRSTGEPVTSDEWIVQPRQSLCPGPVLHRRIVEYRKRGTVAPPAAPYHAESPVMGQPLGTAAQARAWLTQRSKNYDPTSIATIVAEYERVGSAVGVDWFLALAQCAHETANLSAAMSARPVRNPAGIGVTGASSTTPQPGYVWDSDRNLHRAAVTFRAWTEREAQGSVSSVAAHLGRLVAYATPPGARFGPSQALVDQALSVRPLPLACHGSAPTIDKLGRVRNPADPCGWASPGTAYGLAIANLANRMRGL